MKRQKKSSFFTFIWSFLPGAAEMYMGFMKNGFSLMAVFFLSFIILAVLRISDVFILGSVLIWFYCFFHARNMAACSVETLQEMPDVYIWEEFLESKKIQVSNPALRKWAAVALIVCGLVVLWQNFASLLYTIIPDYLWELMIPVIDRIPAVAVSLMIIAVGIHMIMGKKVELDGESNWTAGAGEAKTAAEVKWTADIMAGKQVDHDGEGK